MLPGAGIAQLVEQRTENPRVGSSTLPPGTIFLPLYAGIAQSVERFTRNEEVRGSIPRSSPILTLFNLMLHNDLSLYLVPASAAATKTLTG